MAYLSQTAVYLVLFLSLVSITAGYFGARISYKIKKSSQQVMAKLKLDPSKTKKEFKILFIANFIMVPAMISFAYGAIIDGDLYRNIGRLGYIIFALVIVSVKYKWWRRF